jgi:cobalt-zinc-cadmium efflux system protein
MAHSHDDHEHASAPLTSSAAFAMGVALNLGFVLIEFAYGFAANSLALISDACHNLSDVLGLCLAWAAVRMARALPSKFRTYGLRRASILAALANAIVLLIVVGGISWEAAQRFYQPQLLSGNTVIWVAAVGVVINTASALLFMAGRKNDLNIRGAFLHMASDALVSVGVVAVGLIMRATGWLWLDPLISLLIGLVIIWSTWDLLRESINLALDAVPKNIDPHAVEDYLKALPGVQAVHDLHIWGLSTTEVALTAHLVMPQPPNDGYFLQQLSDALEEKFAIGHCTIQIEHGDVACELAPADVV